MRRFGPLMVAAAMLIASPSFAADPLRATAEALRDKALTDTTAYDTVESLTTEIGPRLVGTPAQKLAMEWGLARLKTLGFQNVHAEPFTAQAWLRGDESAVVTGPFPQSLRILGLGRSIPTPPDGIEAEIVVFNSYDDMLAQPPGALAGKIAVVDQPMVRNQEGGGYGALIKARTAGASEAARRGAVAYLVRSLSTSNARLPHAGAMRYADDAAKIPAAALSVPDAELLAHMVARGVPVRVRLKMASTFEDAVPAWNVVGEVTGSEHPDQVIVIGGHLDSWDPGTGAIDDGAGVAITSAAAKLINDLPRHPKRTIRMVMFGAEEMDYSGAAYAAAHKDEAGKIVLAIECDSGADSIWSVDLPAGTAGQPGFHSLAAVLAPLKIYVSGKAPEFGGSDVEELMQAGAPTIDLHQDATRYFDIHHSADDTLDKIDRAQMSQNVAAWASVLYLAADGDVDFRPPAAQAATAAAK
jgi:hypothetical protein